MPCLPSLDDRIQVPGNEIAIQARIVLTKSVVCVFHPGAATPAARPVRHVSQRAVLLNGFARHEGVLDQKQRLHRCRQALKG